MQKNCRKSKDKSYKLTKKALSLCKHGLNLYLSTLLEFSLTRRAFMPQTASQIG